MARATDWLRCLGARLLPLPLECEEVGGEFFGTSEAFQQVPQQLPRHSRGGGCSIPNRCRRPILASRSHRAEVQFPPIRILCVDALRVVLVRWPRILRAEFTSTRPIHLDHRVPDMESAAPRQPPLIARLHDCAGPSNGSATRIWRFMMFFNGEPVISPLRQTVSSVICALRRQRSEVRIPSGAPAISMSYESCWSLVSSKGKRWASSGGPIVSGPGVHS